MEGMAWHMAPWWRHGIEWHYGVIVVIENIAVREVLDILPRVRKDGGLDGDLKAFEKAHPRYKEGIGKCSPYGMHGTIHGTSRSTFHPHPVPF